MTITQLFVRKLQEVTGTTQFPKIFWETYDNDDKFTFQDFLNKYAEYCSSKDLSGAQQKELSKIFWEQVISVGGTPIVEDSLISDQQCDVYFLAPQNLLEESKERAGTKMDLYLQGDFHGYGSTDGRQQLIELESTGIMFRKNTMPRDALVSYQYIQTEPSHRGKKPVHKWVPFFDDEPETTILDSDIKESPKIEQIGFADEYSTHISLYPGYFHPEKMFRVSSVPKDAHITTQSVDWPSLLSTRNSEMRHFVYHDTLYSDQTDELQHRDASIEIGKEYHDDLYYSDQPDIRPNSPYATFTRAIQVFKPASGIVDNIVVINDGTPYLMTGILDHFEKMVEKNKLSPNTAFVFINPMPGLKTTLSSEKLKAYNDDPNTAVGGMGVRMIDYKYGIEKYADFIATQVFPMLTKEGISVPEDPTHRIMIGASLSGTASIHIGLNHPELFGAIIAQSPSPTNRDILRDVINTESALSKPKTKIHLSCGVFEQPNYADNTNLSYAIGLSQKLHTPLDVRMHGHQFLAWNEVLWKSLPVTLIHREEITQQYRTALETMRDTEPVRKAALEEDGTKHSAPSPFKTSPKPFDDV